MADRPWLQHYPQDVDWNFAVKPAPIPCLLDEAAAEFGALPYIDFLGRRFTYGEIDAMASRAARGFQALGVKKGAKVGLFLSNCPQFIIAFFGILRAGGTVVNYSPLYSEQELQHQIEDSETEIMVTLNTATLYPKMAALLGKTCLRHLVIANLPEVLPFVAGLGFRLFYRRDVVPVAGDDRHTRFAGLLDNDGAYAPVDVDPVRDVAVLQYTGGTTGVPKGAMLSHANIYLNVRQAALWDPETRRGAEKVIGVLPLFHAFAMTGTMLGSAATGAEVLLYPRFDLDRLLKDISCKKATILPAVPTMLMAIIHHPHLQKYDLSSLRRVVSGGAPLPGETKARFEALSGSIITEGYGLTEASPTASVSPLQGLHKEGSIGLPLPGTEIAIVDAEDSHRHLPLGEKGEIAVRGPQVMLGYWHNPEATAKTIVDGWLLTGDIGYMDKDGFTFIVDRKKDMILVSGFNVYPRTVEEAVYQHPAVREVTVIGIPDPYHGETPKAFVVLKDGESLSPGALRDFLKKRLGRHEMPSAIEFRQDLPKTMIGKLSKKELVAEEKARRDTGGE